MLSMDGDGFVGVSPTAERGTTQTGVKVPKCWLSVNLKGCPQPQTAGRWAQKQPSSKQCVTADPPRLGAPKMDGAKPATETPGCGFGRNPVGGRPDWVEVGS